MSEPFVRQGYYPSDDDYYIILNVDFNASQETITTAYRNLARRFHPDKNNQDERSRREAQIIFEKIKNAYDVLGDPHKRKIYDTLGPEGVKLDQWKLVSKQMTAQEIRDEYLKIQRQQTDNQMALFAKPRALFEIAIDATDVFARSKESDDEDDLDEDLMTRDLTDILPSIEIRSMSASMSVENDISKDHSMTLSGSLDSKNGTGDGLFGANYTYKHSPETKFDLLYQVGRGPIVTAGISHKLTKKITVSGHGYLVTLPYDIYPGAKWAVVYKFRDYLVGKVQGKELINSSITTSLIYINEKLRLDLTTSYKLSHASHEVKVDLSHKFNNNNSTLNVALAVNSEEGVAVEYGCETRILDINVIGAALSFNLPAGVTLKIRFNRANQEFSLPIYLSDEIHSAPIFYGTMVPLIAYYLLDKCYLSHYKQLR